jgi:hypothetical protein
VNLPLPPTDWNIDRLTEERTEAVTAFGFTQRQARFLVEVLIHSGVFVERRYCAFAGITTQRYMHLSPAAIEGAIRLLDRQGPAKTGPLVESESESGRGDILETVDA